MAGKFKLPQMKESASAVISAVPDGGINLADDPRRVLDSESPKLLNFWLSGGMLKLRPGMRKLIEQSYGGIIGVYPEDGGRILIERVVKNNAVIKEKYGMYIVTQKAVLSFDGENIERIPDSLEYGTEWTGIYRERTFEECAIIPSGGESGGSMTISGDTWSVKGEAVYIVGSGYFLFVSPKMINYDNPTGVAHVTACCTAGDIDPYVPVLYRNCAPSGSGEKAEQRNLLSKKRVQKYTTNNSDTVYSLCENKIDNDTVTIVYHAELNSLYIFNFPKDYCISIQNDITAELDRKNGTITFSCPLVNAAKYVFEDNLEVTYSKTYDDPPVCRCSRGIWYDGGTQQESGSGRIFLSGDGGAPNRIYYSGSDPSYFADGSYIDIGAPADPVTAFGIQYDVLVVFKRKSVYSLQYSENSGTPSFTVKDVNAQTGCDMPGTLRLLSNMLVWADSWGGVYGLLSTTVKDERAVRLLSRSVNPELLSLPEQDLASASAICDGTYYFLLAGEKAFLFNYENLHFSSAKKPEDATWFIWEFPFKLSHAMRWGDNFAASSDGDGTIYYFDMTAADDCGEFFDAYLYTKKFDFGHPEDFKKISRLSVTAGCESPCAFNLIFDDGVRKIKKKLYADDARFYKRLTVYPASAWSVCACFGVERAQGENTAFCVSDFEMRAVCQARE